MENIAKVIYINLDKRTDRREEIEAELERMGFPKNKIMRLSATSNPGGHVGCALSHLRALEHAQKHQLANVLILEDDFQFLVTREELEERLQHFFGKNLPYDALLFGYNMKAGVKIDAVLGKAIATQTTSGYLASQRVFDHLRRVWGHSTRLLARTGRHWRFAIDVAWQPLQRSGNWYYFADRLGKQRASYSDIQGYVTDYDGKEGRPLA